MKFKKGWAECKEQISPETPYLAIKAMHDQIMDLNASEGNFEPLNEFYRPCKVKKYIAEVEGADHPEIVVVDAIGLQELEHDGLLLEYKEL